MLFKVKEVGFRPTAENRNKIFLIKDNWNDWFRVQNTVHTCVCGY